MPRPRRPREISYIARRVLLQLLRDGCPIHVGTRDDEVPPPTLRALVARGLVRELPTWPQQAVLTPDGTREARSIAASRALAGIMEV
jgi:hypothetical protein